MRLVLGGGHAPAASSLGERSTPRVAARRYANLCADAPRQVLPPGVCAVSCLPAQVPSCHPAQPLSGDLIPVGHACRLPGACLSKNDARAHMWQCPCHGERFCLQRSGSYPIMGTHKWDLTPFVGLHALRGRTPGDKQKEKSSWPAQARCHPSIPPTASSAMRR